MGLSGGGQMPRSVTKGKWASKRKRFATSACDLLELGEVVDDEALAGKVDNSLTSHFVQGGGDSLPGRCREESNLLVGEKRTYSDDAFLHFSEFFGITKQKTRDAFFHILENQIAYSLLKLPESETHALGDL